MGFVMILAIQLAVSSGISRYLGILSSYEIAVKKALITGNLLLWLFAILLGEFLLWRRHKQIVLWKNVDETMSRDEFESAIANGIPLMILDNLVLNVAEFINQHPGGRFLIRHNIGTDISKYFYGGYCLEGNQGTKPAYGYTHSTVARMIINDLIVAIYEEDIPSKTMVCKQLKES